MIRQIAVYITCFIYLFICLIPCDILYMFVHPCLVSDLFRFGRLYQQLHVLSYFGVSWDLFLDILILLILAWQVSCHRFNSNVQALESGRLQVSGEAQRATPCPYCPGHWLVAGALAPKWLAAEATRLKLVMRLPSAMSTSKKPKHV